MKKLISVLSLAVVLVPSGALADAAAPTPQSFSFLSGTVRAVTNGVYYTGINLTNATGAGLGGGIGGFTNINSWMQNATAPVVTNAMQLTWTNNNGIWVIPTNGAIGTASGIMFVTNDSSGLVKDIPLWTLMGGGLPATVTTNNWLGDSTAYAASQINFWAKFNGQASAASSAGLTFTMIGLVGPGLEPHTNAPTFVCSFPTRAGQNIVVTNFPVWKFAGCRSVRMKTVVDSISAAANVGITLQDAGLDGFVP